MLRRRQLMGMQSISKNLFNIFAPFANPNNTAISNTTKRIFTSGTHCLGASYSNYFIAGKITQFEVSPDRTMIVDASGGYGVGYAIEVEAGSSYLVDFLLDGKGFVNRCIYSSDGTPLTNEANNFSKTRPIVIPQYGNICVLIFRNYAGGTPASFSNITFIKMA